MPSEEEEQTALLNQERSSFTSPWKRFTQKNSAVLIVVTAILAVLAISTLMAAAVSLIAPKPASAYVPDSPRGKLLLDRPLIASRPASACVPGIQESWVERSAGLHSNELRVSHAAAIPYDRNTGPGDGFDMPLDEV